MPLPILSPISFKMLSLGMRWDCGGIQQAIPSFYFYFFVPCTTACY